jgi:hypothetical protein
MNNKTLIEIQKLKKSNHSTTGGVQKKLTNFSTNNK